MRYQKYFSILNIMADSKITVKSFTTTNAHLDTDALRIQDGHIKTIPDEVKQSIALHGKVYDSNGNIVDKQCVDAIGNSAISSYVDLNRLEESMMSDVDMTEVMRKMMENGIKVR